MWVFFSVAAFAGRFDIIESLRQLTVSHSLLRMARITRNGGMAACQRKIGLIVIEVR